MNYKGSEWDSHTPTREPLLNRASYGREIHRVSRAFIYNNITTRDFNRQ